jgi:hypothetical protein
MLNNQEKGLTMSRQLSMRGCKSTRGRLIVRVDGLPMVLMDLQMEMVYKPLVEVHTK